MRDSTPAAMIAPGTPLRSRVRTPAIAVVLAVSLVAAGCSAASNSGGAQTACDDHQQLLDTRSFHVLDAEEAAYDIHPPTSGPHTSIVPTAGVHAEPVSEADQVAALEQGWVVANYSDTAAADQVEILEEVARTKDVLVTPAPEPIDDDREIAFTAWGVRQLCDSVTLSDARAFVRQYAGRVGGHT